MHCAWNGARLPKTKHCPSGCHLHTTGQTTHSKDTTTLQPPPTTLHPCYGPFNNKGHSQANFTLCLYLKLQTILKEDKHAQLFFIPLYSSFIIILLLLFFFISFTLFLLSFLYDHHDDDDIILIGKKFFII
jgi:hypothetical protein